MEDLLAATNSYLEIVLTATDSKGLRRVVRQDLQPREVTLTFAASPSGLQLDIQGARYTTNESIISWTGYNIQVNAPDQDEKTFVEWSDGGARSHTIRTPWSSRTYTATFR